jgi:phosphatidylglycerol lysyltransferase
MGIGVVEGVMPLVFISLGVSHSVAILVTLAYRGLSFWLPLLVGFILLHRVKSFGVEERSQARLWDIRLVASLTALMGIINILSAVRPSLASRAALIEKYLPLFVTRGGHLTAALAGFALLVLAVGLWRRKRTAWLLTLVVLVVSIVSHLVTGLDYEEALLAAGVAVWLFALRPYFHVRSDLPSIRQGVRLLIGALLFTLAYGVIGFYLLDYHFSVNFNFGAALRQTIVMFTQFYDPGLQPLTGFGRYFAASIYVVGAFTTAYALLMLIRPVLVRQPATPAERARAQKVVEMYGRTTLARMTLFNDKSYYFSTGGSMVAYAAKGRAAVALGDPIGPPGDAAAAIDEFRAYCLKNDWLPAFYQTLPDYLEHYKTAGFNTICIGHDAVVETASFYVSGKKYKSMRAAINRLVRLGYEAKVHQPPLSDDLLAELRLVSDEWLTMVHDREKRFSLGWFNDDYIRSGAVVAIHPPAGRISAFVNVVPEYRHNEITIDLMRRRADTENGTMDFLFVSLIEWARANDYESVSLGLSPFWGVGQQPDDPVSEHTLHYIYDHLNQFYNFQGLHLFKEKFQPRWSPRYLAYPGSASLPAVVMALNRVSSGDDFIWQYYKEFVSNRLKPILSIAGDRLFVHPSGPADLRR